MLDIVPRSLAVKMDSWKRSAKLWTPWEYQERGLKFMLQDAQCGLLLDPGMGKTSITLAAIKILLAKKLIKRVLIVAPLRAIYEVWPEQVCAWKDFNGLGVALLHGSGKNKALRALTSAQQICLINPEGFQWLVADKSRLKAVSADMLVIDESSKWKNSASVRFRALRPVLMQFRRRYILTGSPRPRNYLDLFGQIYILDRGAALGAYITHYRNRFFYPTGWQLREWAPLPDSPDKINALVAPMVLRLDAKDYLKLPGTPDRLHRVELPSKARAIYDQIEEKLMSTLFTEPLQNSAAARSKCCQIANGSVYTDSIDVEQWTKRRTVQVIHTAKVEALMDLYEELQGEPLLVGIGYRHDVEAIQRAAGWAVPVLNSTTTKAQFSDYIEKWNKGELDLLLGHPASMGHALNMQKCNGRHVAMFDLPDDYDNYDQMFRRVWRQGNKADFVMRHHFVVTNTVDVAKMKNLERKGTGQNAFLKAMKEYADARRKR